MSIARSPSHGLWRKSATLLLITPDKNNMPKVLMVKRSKNARFMPNRLVFPGGLSEPSDFSLDWLKNSPSLTDFTVPHQASFPDIFTNDSPAPIKELSPHAGFRINAIRELFEETGIFLAGKDRQMYLADNSWRDRVCANPDDFITMCDELGLSIDVTRLNNWSTWLTPTNLSHSARRYDTQFYITFLDNLDEFKLSAQNREVAEVKSLHVLDVLSSWREVVAPPQLYELSRLAALGDVDSIRDYAKRRDQLGTERIFPTLFKCSDGLMSVLPGDSLYPAIPDLLGTGPAKETDKTVKECMELYPKHHRITMQRRQPYKLHVNIQLNQKQQAPNTSITKLPSNL